MSVCIFLNVSVYKYMNINKFARGKGAQYEPGDVCLEQNACRPRPVAHTAPACTALPSKSNRSSPVT